jgi:amino acid adenylation domain-containing protein/non-ribosomal peptide synthase protein (TIGR01720 family)
MVPGVLVSVKELPLTPNGKLDRRALAKVKGERLGGGKEYVGARTAVEELLSGIWARVLGVERVGVEDNFFDLGGNSLLTTQVVAQARRVFGVELELRKMFERPTVAGLGEAVEEAWRAGEVEKKPLVKVERAGELPLSYAQERLWFLDQLEPGSTTYNVSMAVRMQGGLEVGVLERALIEVVRRHEVLRTRFTSTLGKATQIIEPIWNGCLEQVDIHTWSKSERAVELQRLVVAQVNRPFDLSRGPLFRACVMKLEETEHVLVLTMHHIVSDAWSRALLVREIAALYAAFLNGKESPLPELQIQYADYAVWQREWLQGEVLERQLDYWRRQLEDLPVLELPTDHPRPATPTHFGAQEWLYLPPELTNRLKDLGRQEGLTLFMVLLGSFQLLLSRYSGQEDMTVGTSVANRVRAELEELIGFFINQLVLRTDLSKDPTIRELLGRVREVCLGAYARQDLPFELLVEELNPQRDLARTPLFQVMLILQNVPFGKFHTAGLELEGMIQEDVPAKFDLLMSVDEEGQALKVRCFYATDLFHAATIKKLLAQWDSLLQTLVADCGRRVSSLDILTEEERRQVLLAPNQTAVNYGAAKCLHELFENRALSCPNNIAVIYEDQQLTYSDLNRRTNQLACFLQNVGVKAETRVGLFVERSLEMVIGILGTLKAGGTYVPLDPEYPMERLNYLLQDAGLQTVLMQHTLKLRLPPLSLPVICLDSDWEIIGLQSENHVSANVDAANGAYMIYTSGSTGRPKGVLIEHQAIHNRLMWMQAQYGLNDQDRVLQKTPFSFDVSVWEFFWPLLQGATLVMAKPEGHRDANYLLNAIQEFGITTLHFVPSMLRAFLGAGNVRGLKLKRVFCSGEALDIELCRNFSSCLNSELHNLYGPTEAAVDVSYWEYLPNWSEEIVPIGKPVANTQMYVLDRYMNPLPAGVPGELYLGGVQLARGYWNRPELTAAQFVPDPFSAVPGQRLYRSGDRARYRSDEAIEYLGRTDYQVKIRGHRIELGEIEHAMNTHRRVRQSVVVVREEQSGTKRLVGYVVFEPSLNQDEQGVMHELRDYLRARLPEYMVPSLFVPLSELPLTPSGKLDRRALPAPGETSGLRREYVAPRTPAEETLATIWAKVLGKERVGIEDNFFDLGGDSIVSIQVVARANQAGLRIAPKHIFEFPTISGLALMAHAGPAVVAQQGAVHGTVPLTPIQKWFFENVNVVPHHFNQSVFLELKEKPAPGQIEKIVARLLAHHDSLRLRFAGEGVLRQWMEKEEDISRGLVRVDLCGIPEEQLHLRLEQEAAQWQRSLDLRNGPILRIVWFETGKGHRDRLLWIIHHLAVDGVSWRILLEDFDCLWQGQGELDAALPSKTTSFKEWAVESDRYANEHSTAQALAYWRKAAKAASRLPVDCPGDNIVESVEQVMESLNSEETTALLQRVPPVYHTQINDVLLTALVDVLAERTGSPRVCVDLEGHGREHLFDHLDVSRTVGWFTTMFPVLIEKSYSRDAGERLRSVKEQLRQVPQQGIGYGWLRYIKDDEVLRHERSSDVLFNYLGQLDQAAESKSFKMAQESSGARQDPRSRRSHLLEIVGSVTGGQLRMRWSYSRQQFKSDTVQRMAARFMAALREVIDHCETAQTGIHTPSDFSLVDVDQATLNRLALRTQQMEQR